MTAQSIPTRPNAESALNSLAMLFFDETHKMRTNTDALFIWAIERDCLDAWEFESLGSLPFKTLHRGDYC